MRRIDKQATNHRNLTAPGVTGVDRSSTSKFNVRQVADRQSKLWFFGAFHDCYDKPIANTFQPAAMPSQTTSSARTIGLVRAGVSDEKMGNPWPSHLAGVRRKLAVYTDRALPARPRDGRSPSEYRW